MAVDLVIFIQQAGNNRHKHIYSSLELFADQPMPDFKARHAAHIQQQNVELAPYIEKAMSKIDPQPQLTVITPLESYPVLMQQAYQPVDGDVCDGDDMVSTIVGKLKE